VEACEFDRSFLHLVPHSAAILNIEPDHFDCYHSLDEIVEVFARFAERVEHGGLLVCNAEDGWTLEAAADASARVQTFGFHPYADWEATNLTEERGRFCFDAKLRGRLMLSAQLLVPGRHNVANALAAIALAFEAGAEPAAIAEGISTFRGVDRRLSWRGDAKGVVIMDDYAHHPTEIRATIEAARLACKPRRTWAVFQPHQLSRTRELMEDFAGSFNEVDEVIIPPVYAAREVAGPPHAQGSAELADRIHQRGQHARHLATLAEVTEHLMGNVEPGDLVLTMGAGDVWKVADELVTRIR